MTNEEAIKILKFQRGYFCDLKGCEEHQAFTMSIKALEQEPKTGHWIESDIPNEKYICSECGGACWYYDYQGDVAKSRFCPNCGAKME